ncbi:hypothetical protein [Streptomyces sp. NPDC002855]|uniref:DUF6907 domain-containing protein n=1 Tax=Streptomyces sp. NPDC002855 TaxID=3154437 RepID=UPI0033279D99
MSAPRTVTVQTGDHGPVTLDEPFWCTGVHPPVDCRSDIVHDGEESALVIETPCHGPVRVAAAALLQYPFGLRDRQVRVLVEFDELHEYDAATLAVLADSLVAYAVGPLHGLIERLQLLEGGDGS